VDDISFTPEASGVSAPPGMTLVSVGVALKNLQTDRTAPFPKLQLEVFVPDYNFSDGSTACHSKEALPSAGLCYLGNLETPNDYDSFVRVAPGDSSPLRKQFVFPPVPERFTSRDIHVYNVVHKPGDVMSPPAFTELPASS
jgi:hypothetical protein